MKLHYQDITIQKVKTLFINNPDLIQQPYQMQRLDHDNKRMYFTFDNDWKPFFFMSVTTFLKYSLPTSPGLIEWMVNYKPTAEAPTSGEYARQRAEYGTFMHIQNAELLMKGKYNLNLVGKKLEKYMKQCHVPLTLLNRWTEEMKKDILAFAQFIQDHKVKPIAIEMVLGDKDTGLATAIDLICLMEIEEKGFFGEVYKSGVNKGQPKETKRKREVLAIIDEKSGRKGFHEDNELQLEACKQIWNKHFLKLQVEKVFNWSPKAWKGNTPSYNLKDQTTQKSIEKFTPLLELAKIELEKNIGSMTITKNMIRLNSDLTKNVQVMTLDSIVADVARKERAAIKRKAETEDPRDNPLIGEHGDDWVHDTEMGAR